MYLTQRRLGVDLTSSDEDNLYSHQLVGGWATPLKHVKVNLDYEIPKCTDQQKMFQTTSQPIISWAQKKKLESAATRVTT